MKFWKNPTFELSAFWGIAFGFAYFNDQPRHKYKSSNQWISIVFLFLHLQVCWGIEYKSKTKAAD